MNSKNVLAARLLASLHHEMCVSASAAHRPQYLWHEHPWNDSVIASAGLRIVDSPNIEDQYFALCNGWLFVDAPGLPRCHFCGS